MRRLTIPTDSRAYAFRAWNFEFASSFRFRISNFSVLPADAPCDYRLGMNFFLSIIAYLVIGFVLTWGILSAMHGTWWVLAAGVMIYVLVFARVGCLPKKS